MDPDPDVDAFHLEYEFFDERRNPNCGRQEL
jgi:hypothetical protein